MIFRVIDNKLYEIKIYIKDEDEFINKNSTLNLIKVDQGKLPKYTGEEVDEIFYALDKDGNIVIDEDRTKARVIEYKKERKEELLKALTKLCDFKCEQAKRYINGGLVTPEQEQRYEAKYNMAKAYLKDGSYKDLLQAEANLTGKTVDDLAKLIVTVGDQYKTKLDYYYSLIEAFRVRTKAYINNEKFSLAEAAIDNAYSFAQNADETTLENFFKNLESGNKDNTAEQA